MLVVYVLASLLQMFYHSNDDCHMSVVNNIVPIYHSHLILLYSTVSIIFYFLPNEKVLLGWCRCHIWMSSCELAAPNITSSKSINIGFSFNLLISLITDSYIHILITQMFQYIQITKITTLSEQFQNKISKW
jgi:hypothetical protein